MCRHPQLPGPHGALAYSPRLPPTSMSPQAPPHQSVGWCPLGPSITNSSHKQVHTWVQACTHIPVCRQGPPSPALRAPACLLCWAGEQEGAVKGKKTERRQGGKHPKSAQLGWVWSRPLSPAHNSPGVLPHPHFSRSLTGGKRGQCGAEGLERGQKSRVSQRAWRCRRPPECD